MNPVKQHSAGAGLVIGTAARPVDFTEKGVFPGSYRPPTAGLIDATAGFEERCIGNRRSVFAESGCRDDSLPAPTPHPGSASLS